MKHNYLKRPFIVEGYAQTLFSIQHRKVTYLSDDQLWSHILLSNPISNKNIFKCKIHRLTQRNMAVGVIDIAFLKDRRVNLDEENYVCYFGVGTIWGSGGPRNVEKEGYHEGDILEVMVDQKEGLITWSVNGLNKTEKTL